MIKAQWVLTLCLTLYCTYCTVLYIHTRLSWCTIQHITGNLKFDFNIRSKTCKYSVPLVLIQQLVMKIKHFRSFSYYRVVQWSTAASAPLWRTTVVSGEPLWSLSRFITVPTVFQLLFKPGTRTKHWFVMCHCSSLGSSTACWRKK